MSEKDKINKENMNEEDFEIEFVDNEEPIELEDVTEEDYEENVDVEEDYDEIEYNPDEDYDADANEQKGKLTRNQLVNRIIAGMGIAIAVFTVFYGIVAYGMLNNNDSAVEEEETTVKVEEETTPQSQDNFFVSANTDENISDDVKDLLKGAKLDQLRTGHSKLDANINKVLEMTCKSDMTTYEKVRNIYDYMMYFYEVKSSSYVDNDSIYEFCSSYEYTSKFDMEIIYRANKLFENKSGDSKDYACAFTVLLRNIGIEAYYIEGEKMGESEYQSHGYTVVVLDGKNYIFDVAEEDELSANSKVEYKVFCKTISELEEKYSDEGLEESMKEFNEFETLGEFSFNAKISSSGGAYVTGSVGYSNSYSEKGNTSSTDDIIIDISENVYFKGSVSGSDSNTWKLLAKVYDEDKNYITEATIYNSSTDSRTDEVTYTPARGGYVKLIYMVTDSNGRTCAISVMVKVQGYEEPATTGNNTASDGELN